MRKGLTRAVTGVAVGVLGLLLGTTAGEPCDGRPRTTSSIWEEGTVTSVSDGDTLTATMDAGPGAPGTQRVRTIGVQAPEVAPTAECGSAQATERLRAQLPVGIAGPDSRRWTSPPDDDYSRRPTSFARSTPRTRRATGSTPLAARSATGGCSGSPSPPTRRDKPEWAHNLEYRVLADDAAARRRASGPPTCAGARATPDLQRPGVGQVLRAPSRCTSRTTAPSTIDLSGWIDPRLRASSGYRTAARPETGASPAPAAVRRGRTRGDLNLQQPARRQRRLRGRRRLPDGQRRAATGRATCARGSPTPATRTTAATR